MHNIVWHTSNLRGTYSLFFCRALANGLLIASHTTQIGLDPSRKEDPIAFQIATLSVQTHSLLLVEAIWQDACSTKAISRSDVSINAYNNIATLLLVLLLL